MKCKHYEKYAWLNRPGELSAAEEAKWRAHRDECPDCQSLFTAVQAQQNQIKTLRTETAPGHAPASLATATLQHIAELEKRGEQNWSNIFGCPAMQWAQAAIVLVFCSLYLWQAYLAPAAIQGSALIITHAAAASSGSSLDFPELAYLGRHRPCLAKVREWTREQIICENRGIGTGKTAKKSSLLQRAESQERTRQLAALLQECGWQGEELDYLLHHSDILMRRLFSS
jgi:hypothetical protein